MAVDKPQLDPGMLELLYPDELGELDEAELQALREHAALSDEDVSDLKDFESLLERVRAEDPGEDVPDALHASIMDAARSHHQITPAAANNESRADRTATRAPQVPEAERDDMNRAKPLWARISAGTGGQIALVATVMLVAGFLFVTTRVNKSPEQKFSQANSSVTSDVIFGGGAPSGGKGQAATDQPQETAEFAKAESFNDNLGKGDTELALNTELEAEGESGPSATDESAERPAPSYRGRESKSAPRAKPAPPTEKPSSRRASRAQQPNRAKTQKDTKKKMRSLKSKTSPSNRATDSASKQILDAEPSKSSNSTKSAPAKPTTPSAESDDALAEFATGGASPEQQSEERADKTPAQPASTDAMAQSFTSGHYDETQVRADAILADTGSSSGDKAQALDYKARAQEASNDPGGALDTYQDLQTRFPKYRSGHIADEIARLDKKLNTKPALRRRMNKESAPAMDSNIDLSDEPSSY